jgi:hypothetical protein
MVDEVISRCSSFSAGRRIQLADGQTWSFPLPTKEWLIESWPDRTRYIDLIDSVMESQESSDRCLAELAFGIFLLGQNYQLSPADYQSLLDFGADSTQSNGLRLALHELAQEHAAFLSEAVGHRLEMRPESAYQGRFSRVLSWLCVNFPLRWRVFNSRCW